MSPHLNIHTLPRRRRRRSCLSLRERLALFFVFAAAVSVRPAVCQPAPRESRVVVVVVADRLLPEELLRWSPVGFRSLLNSSAAAVLSNRAASYGGEAGGYASIGAGAGVAVPSQPLPSSAGELPAYIAAMQSSSAQAHDSGSAGALGQAVEDAGGFTAVIGNSWDHQDAAALIATDERGAVSVDQSEAGAVAAPSWPWGARSSPSHLAAAAAGILDSHPNQRGLIVIDFGDSSRVDQWVWLNHPTPSDAQRARARWMPVLMKQLSELMIPLARSAALHQNLLCLVSPAPPRTAAGGPLPGLTPVVFLSGFPAGALRSASTRRSGLLLSLDLAPTFLEYLGIPVPRSMTGQPAAPATTSAPAPGWLAAVFRLDSRSRADYSLERWGLIVYGIFAGFALLLPSVLPARRLLGSRARIAQYFLLAGAAGPAALILPMAFDVRGIACPACLMALFWLLIPLLCFRFKSDSLRLGAACAAPALVLALDGLSRGTLFRDALWGRMPIGGGRLYGIDNTCMGVFIGAAWVAAGILADASPRPRRGRAAAVSGVFLVALILGLPPLGANVGGGITAAVGAGFFAARLLWKRGAVAGVVFGVLCALLLLALSLVLDASQALAPGSHLIHSWRQVTTTGSPAAGDIIVRKLRQNVSLTFWLLPGVIPIALIVRMIRANMVEFRKGMVSRPGLSAALTSLLPTMVVGYLTNDTGVVADVFIVMYYFAPFVHQRLQKLAGEESSF